jgi:hypothetical protein
MPRASEHDHRSHFSSQGSITSHAPYGTDIKEQQNRMDMLHPSNSRAQSVLTIQGEVPICELDAWHTHYLSSIAPDRKAEGKVLARP